MCKRILVSLFTMLLVLCGCNQDKHVEAPKPDEETVLYTVFSDEKFSDTNERVVRVKTDAVSQNDFEQITKEIMEAYRDEHLDSLHLYMHEIAEPQEKAALKAHSFIAYTNAGAEQVGLDQGNTYRLDMNEK